ncbi:MAG: M28 family peptidase [Acidobacteria bacterium]|nr:M28 family peptidase [Acidobacteriota bacterium]
MPRRTPRPLILLLGVALTACDAASGRPLGEAPPLIPATLTDAILSKASGERALKDVERLSKFSRRTGSGSLHSAALHVAERARSAGLKNVQILSFPESTGSSEAEQVSHAIRPGRIEMVTGEIPGAGRDDQDVVLTAHLDRRLQGASDDASGAAVLLEVARVAHQLISERQLLPPSRGLRFWWVTGFQSARAYFLQHPEETRRILANINVDQAGGDKRGRSDFVAILQPRWLGSFIDDLIRNLAERTTADLGEVGEHPSPRILESGGSRGPFLLRLRESSLPGDQAVFSAAGIEIPSISVRVVSPSLVRTGLNPTAQQDPTQLKRSVYLASACGLYLAGFRPADAPRLFAAVRAGSHARLAAAEYEALVRIAQAGVSELEQERRMAYFILEQAYERESRILASLARFRGSGSEREARESLQFRAQLTWNLYGGQEAAIALLEAGYQRRCKELGHGPVDLQPEAEEERLNLVVPSRTLQVGPGFERWLDYRVPSLSAEAGLEVLNFIDGTRSVAEIYHALAPRYPELSLGKLETILRELEARHWIQLGLKAPPA